jgi:hypothetical protein
MARNVFFSFHYQNDIFRVNTVRNHATTKGGYSAAGYFDKSLWETVQKDSGLAIKRMINGGLEGTTVTVVLIGSQTANRTWVNYEIEKSHERGNGMIGIYIHQIASAQTQTTDVKGKNPFDFIHVAAPQQFSYMAKRLIPLSNLYPTYDWVDDDGYNNFESWVEAAAKKAGK